MPCHTRASVFQPPTPPNLPATFYPPEPSAQPQIPTSDPAKNPKTITTMSFTPRRPFTCRTTSGPDLKAGPPNYNDWSISLKLVAIGERAEEAVLKAPSADDQMVIWNAQLAKPLLVHIIPA